MLQYFNNLIFLFIYLQTENPNNERPYTFKDFLLHPRRLAGDFTAVFTTCIPACFIPKT